MKDNEDGVSNLQITQVGSSKNIKNNKKIEKTIKNNKKIEKTIKNQKNTHSLMNESLSVSYLDTFNSENDSLFLCSLVSLPLSVSMSPVSLVSAIPADKAVESSLFYHEITINGTISSALLDSGASSCFMTPEIAKKLGIPLVSKTHPRQVIAANQTAFADPILDETIPVLMDINGHQEYLVFNIVSPLSSSIILGLPWFQRNCPVIDWNSKSINFPCPVPDSPCLDPLAISLILPSNNSDIKLLSSAQWQSSVLSDPDYSIFEVHVAPITETWKSETVLPPEFQKYSDVFNEEDANLLPQHRPYDIGIELEENTTPPFGPLYSLTEEESRVLKKYIDDMLSKGFIRPSSSSAGAPVLFAKKPKADGSLRLCIDYRGLNQITKKNRYPVPLIPELIDRLRSAAIYSKIDLKGAYNLVRVKEGDEWKTAFRTRFGHYEYLVMPFGLTNAPAVFQHLMNDVFRQYLDQFVVIYLDDILIFSNSMEEHTEHVLKVLKLLQENALYASLQKSSFYVTHVTFLGFVISPIGISMDPFKVKAITEWKSPKNLKELQSFLGFANFYRRFIPQFAQIAIPLTALLRKDTAFHWSSLHDIAFTTLKSHFTSSPVLAHYDPSKVCVVETDASDFAQGAVLSQPDDEGILHPIAFWSRKFAPAELNYEIYDKELLAIKNAFEEWRAYLIGTQKPIQVITDHKNLEYFMSTKKLNRRQVRWSLFFSDFNFTITYRPGSLQTQADALSRKGSDHITLDESTKTSMVKLLDSPTLLSLATLSTSDLSVPFIQDLLPVLETDDFFIKTCAVLEGDRDEDSDFELSNGLLYYKQLLYIPPSFRTLLLEEFHDSRTTGHFGTYKTHELLSRYYWWPKMIQSVKFHVQSCDICARVKSRRHPPYGLLFPLPIPPRPWSSVAMDHITGFPKIKDIDAITVIVCRLTKYAHFCPSKTTLDAPQTAQLFFENIVRLHGVPDTLVTDRQSTFISSFWISLWKLLGTKRNTSTAYHPQTDGQSEITNQTLEQYLRCFTTYHQDNWTALLPFAEFAYNNSVHASTKMTPFFANYGYNPRFNPGVPTDTVNPSAEKHILEIIAIQEFLKITLAEAQTNYKKYADRHRSVPPEYEVGDLVYLNRKHIATTAPSEKLDTRFIGPYAITEKINPVVYRLALPANSRIHPVFHVSLLEPRIPPAEDRTPQPIPPVEFRGVVEYFVENILDCKVKKRQFYYLVQWDGYPASHNSWEPLSNVQNSMELLQQFHRLNPTFPCPAGVRASLEGDNVRVTRSNPGVAPTRI